MRIALAQLNLTVGDIPGNTAKIIAAIHSARAQDATVLLTPELAVIGYPPRDLLLKPHLIALCAQAVQSIAEASVGITTLVGYPEKNLNSVGRSLHNAVAVVRDGKILTKHFKSLLPTYDVFDESRYFEPGPTLLTEFQSLENKEVSAANQDDQTRGNKGYQGGVQEVSKGENGGKNGMHGGSERGLGGGGSPVETAAAIPQNSGITFIDDQIIGLSICEDLWNDEQMLPRTLYHNNPIESLARAGARLLFNLSASPFAVGKNNFRHQLFSHQAKRWQMPIAYVNQVGANDDLIFDGNSVVFDKNGNILAQAKPFEEDLLIVDLDKPTPPSPLSPLPSPLSPIASIHSALLLGIRDYLRKCNFKTVVLGLSGGIDSAVVAALAAQALGPKNVHGIALPSRYSSEHSISDAGQLAENLGIHFQILPITPAHEALEKTLAPIFSAAATSSDLAEQNLQARIRGNLLMALSNKFGHLLLTTGNKSEVATGYCTLYGDMCGGLAVISDVPKMMVYELAHYINTTYIAPGLPGGTPAPSTPPNANHPIPHTPYPIPQGTLTKPPSAELRPDQKDEDSLPPYPVLDAILQAYVEEEKSAAEIIALGLDAAIVQRVIRLVDLNEYKRKQMPPGLKVTSRAFGTGRRMPIAARFL